MQAYTNAAYLCIALCVAVLPSSAGAQEKQDKAVDMQQERNIDKAIFAGGCFWCMEKPFEQLDGVLTVVAGYSNGHTKNPTYQDYAAAGHLEVIEISYDSKQVSYETLLDVFWHQIDPTDAGGQFADRGYAYSSAIFYLNLQQKELAEASKQALNQRHIFAKPIVTPIEKAQVFYAAEPYHQNYYKENPMRYWYYRKGSGRDLFLQKVWGDSAKEKEMLQHMKAKLTPLQYKVTQEGGTEPPFNNSYWDHKEEGIYVDLVSGEALFSSQDKFESGTGWPSFIRPLMAENIVEKIDQSFFSTRTEIRSKAGKAHLGHVFQDGPPPTGLRYCINSAALRFIAVDALAAEGFDMFVESFK